MSMLAGREADHLKGLPELLKLPESHFSRSLPRQRSANILCLLDTFILLMVRPPATTNGQVNCPAHSNRGSPVRDQPLVQSGPPLLALQ